MSDLELERLIAAWLDGLLSEADSQKLQATLRDSRDARQKFLAFTHLDAAIRGLVDNDFGLADEMPTNAKLGSTREIGRGYDWAIRSASWIALTLAAVLLVMIGGFGYQLGKYDATPNSSGVPIAKKRSSLGNVPSIDSEVSGDEQTLDGYATLRHVAEIQWSAGAVAHREGDVLPAGLLEFDGGVIEIDFFCGATVVVEGPAKLDLESDWSVRLIAGRLRANVPPAARGFIVKAIESEIVDLGTEFALEVKENSARVEVVDGEIELRGGAHAGTHLFAGEGQLLTGEGVADDQSFKDLSTIGDVERRRETEHKARFVQWRTHSQELRKDPRLIAYYPIAASNFERFVPNATDLGSELDGKLIGEVNRSTGRFGADSNSLGFDRPGARVRARVDGEFEAFTFVCWVKIDSLSHLYNSLFMGDGYENGEPHWQVHEDGRIMFSVMVDDTPGSRPGGPPEARFHRIYYTDSAWDASLSGKWIQLAAVYDPVGRQVRQYVDGMQVSNEAIKDEFLVKKLRIGPAEIGNWGQPLRDSPSFAVRNLNGMIDELAIFKAALSKDEIAQLYEQGKPFGY